MDRWGSHHHWESDLFVILHGSDMNTRRTGEGSRRVLGGAQHHSCISEKPDIINVLQGCMDAVLCEFILQLTWWRRWLFFPCAPPIIMACLRTSWSAHISCFYHRKLRLRNCRNYHQNTIILSSPQCSTLCSWNRLSRYNPEKALMLIQVKLLF